jgi:GTP pyrophosphokinase
MANDHVLTAEEVIASASAYMTSKDIEFIERAYLLAKDAHKEQFRKSGEPYIVHPTQVAGILVDLKMDPATVAAGFLHDVVEDTDIDLESLGKNFNQEVSMLVDGVTKLGKIKFKSIEEQQAENHRKMFVAMAKDIRVILIKLADRLHNMRTLKHLPPEKQRRIANETLEIFAPLAHRLGINRIKWELEDTSLRYLNQQNYYRIVNLMKKKRTEREDYLNSVMRDIKEKLEELNIECNISGRPKHIYSIYKKMTEQAKEFNEIYDLMAVRVLVDSIKDCYAVLGIIHTHWKPMPGRFKDYIAMPKANMYQSLHTTVIGNTGETLEVQIRTSEMHEVAEFGIAAHWAYKEGKAEDVSQHLQWTNQILEWQKESYDTEDFLESLKIDLFSDTVFIFSPKGDVYELPRGSVPIDYAYRVHSEIGNKTIGAKINGKLVPLDYTLKTGDIIEIMTSKHSYGPSQDWLKIAQTSQAKNKIRQFFKKQNRDQNVDKGREQVEKEVRSLGIDLKDAFTQENIKRVLERFHVTSLEDLYAAVGYGGLTPIQVTTRLTEKIRRQQKEQETLATLSKTVESKSQNKRKKDAGVKVEGIDNMLVRLSKCCTPVPGDEIVGFITRGRGVSVHRLDCPNVQNEDSNERILNVVWNDDSNVSREYNVDIEILAFDRQGVLNEVLHAVSETHTNITAVSGRSDKTKLATINMTISISNLQHLKRVVDRIKQIRDITAVRRIMQ